MTWKKKLRWLLLQSMLKASGAMLARFVVWVLVWVISRHFTEFGDVMQRLG